MTQFMALKSPHSDKWVVMQEIGCINGLAAWFTIAVVPEADPTEIGYSDGAIGSAQMRAEFITKALRASEQAQSIVTGSFAAASLADHIERETADKKFTTLRLSHGQWECISAALKGPPTITVKEGGT